MKYFLLIIFLLLNLYSFSQDLFISTNTGYTIGEMTTLKKNILYTGIIIGSEFYIKHDLGFNIGLGGSTLRFDFVDTLNRQIYSTKRFFNVPVSIRKYYNISPKSKGFIDFGFMNSFFYRDKEEIRYLNVNKKRYENNLGYNLGLLFCVGFKTRITERISFDFGFTGNTDFYLKYKKETNKIKTDTKALKISFYRNLGK